MGQDPVTARPDTGYNMSNTGNMTYSPTEYPMTGGGRVNNIRDYNDNATSGGASVFIAMDSSDPDNNKFFVPNTLPVSKGSTVTWTNQDTALHTVTSGTSNGGHSGYEFDSSYLDPGKSFQHTFNSVEKFKYYCTLHPFMRGIINYGNVTYSGIL